MLHTEQCGSHAHQGSAVCPALGQRFRFAPWTQTEAERPGSVVALAVRGRPEMVLTERLAQGLAHRTGADVTF